VRLRLCGVTLVRTTIWLLNRRVMSFGHMLGLVLSGRILRLGRSIVTLISEVVPFGTAHENASESADPEDKLDNDTDEVQI